MHLFQSSQYLSLAAWNRSVWTAHVPSYLHFKSEGSCQVRVLLLKMHEQSVQERLSGQRSAACLKNSWKRGFFYCPLTCRYGERKTVAWCRPSLTSLQKHADTLFILFYTQPHIHTLFHSVDCFLPNWDIRDKEQERSPFTYNLCVGQASIFIIRHGPEGKNVFCPAFILDGNFQRQLCKTSACWVQIKNKEQLLFCNIVSECRFCQSSLEWGVKRSFLVVVLAKTVKTWTFAESLSRPSCAWLRFFPSA